MSITEIISKRVDALTLKAALGGTSVHSPGGIGRVTRINVIDGTTTVIIGETQRWSFLQIR